MLSKLFKTLPRMFAEVKSVQKVGKQQDGGHESVITTYENGELIPHSALALKKTEDIEAYVITIVRDYFRTTRKTSVTKESTLEEHGLDSLDAMELAMQLEEDLGYVISTETLSQFHSVKHYITYIQQVEAFKRENNRTPIP